MIEDDSQLARTCEWIGKMYRQERDALAEPAWAPPARESVAEDVRAQRRRLEREVLEYLQTRRTGEANVPSHPAPKL